MHQLHGTTRIRTSQTIPFCSEQLGTPWRVDLDCIGAGHVVNTRVDL
jgi:hypothetical protein